MKVAGDSRRPHPRNTSVTDPRAAAAAPSEGVLRHDRRRGVPPSGADELRRENATRARGASAPRRQARREPGRRRRPPATRRAGADRARGRRGPPVAHPADLHQGLDGDGAGRHGRPRRGRDAAALPHHRRSGRPHADLIGGGLEARGSGIGTGRGGEGEGSRLAAPASRARPTSTARAATAATSRRRGGRARFFAPPERPPRPRRPRAGPYVCRPTSTPRSPRRLGARAAPLARPSRSPRPRPRRPRDRGLQPTRNRRQVSSSCWGPVGATHTHTGLKATRTSPDVEPDATAGQAGAAARHPGRRRPREPVPPARGPIASSRAADAQARHLHSSRSTCRTFMADASAQVRL